MRPTGTKVGFGSASEPVTSVVTVGVTVVGAAHVDGAAGWVARR
jgi:hypothetical protein